MIDAGRLKESWARVARHGDQVPLFFYSTLFLSHPDTRDMFPVSMANQRDKLVAALGQVISNVDDLDAVVPVLRQLGRDHRKFGVTPDHYPAVGGALLATLEHFSGGDWDDELARSWAAAYGVVAEVMIDGAAAASETPPWWDVTVRSVERRALGVAVLEVTPHAPLAYRAGQSVAVEVPTRPRVWRYLTPATLPAPDGSFELHVRLVPGGAVSTAVVQGARPGDVWRVGPPVGERLTLDRDDDGGVVMLAGGTGIAPMKALLQQMSAHGDPRRVRVFWGAATTRELYDLAAVGRLVERLDDALLHPCVSAEPVDGPGWHVGNAAEVALRHGPWRSERMYVCGSPAMVQGTVEALRRTGVDDARIHTEPFGSEEHQR